MQPRAGGRRFVGCSESPDRARERAGATAAEAPPVTSTVAFIASFIAAVQAFGGGISIAVQWMQRREEI